MKLDIKNFRSIRDQSVELAPITVLYGPNGSGKSSLLYSLLVMKSLALCFESRSTSLFDLGFVNLGDFRAVIHDHRIRDKIRFRLLTTEDVYPVTWDLSFGFPTVEFGLRVASPDEEQDIFSQRHWTDPPFELAGTVVANATFGDLIFEVHWNGICATAKPEYHEAANQIDSILNGPVDLIRSIAIAPLQMAFSRGEYSVARVGSSLNSTLFFGEDEVGTLLATRRYLQSPVSKYLEEITNRTLRVFSPPDNQNFSIDVEDRSTGLETELVNDGYGVNRVAWLLALTLHDETRLMCIEEPETHLHPTSIRKLVKTFVNIMHNENKRFLFTTHSEAFALAILSEVARGHLKPDDVAFYLTSKDGKETKFERQEINKHGQVEGGLTSFMEGELEDLAVLYGETS